MTIGDMVLDTAAGKVRDVDITVTITDKGVTSAFKAYEVKGENAPLDVVTVEQLCLKLKDMPSVTARAIVSTSGFTKPAVAKAQAHGVRVFHLKPWTESMAAQFKEFSEAGPPADFFRHFYSTLLTWVDHHIYLVTPSHPEPFDWNELTPVHDSNGRPHREFKNGSGLREALLMRSTEGLLSVQPVRDKLEQMPQARLVEGEEIFGEKWAYGHTMDLSKDGIFLKLDAKLIEVTQTTISGHLQWHSRKCKPEFFILEDVVTREAFAGAAIFELGNPTGDLIALIFSPDSRAADVQTIRLEPKHKNAIRQLKIRGGANENRPPSKDA